jgi:hypothetical protein
MGGGGGSIIGVGVSGTGCGGHFTVTLVLALGKWPQQLVSTAQNCGKGVLVTLNFQRFPWGPRWCSCQSKCLLPLRSCVRFSLRTHAVGSLRVLRFPPTGKVDGVGWDKHS